MPIAPHWLSAEPRVATVAYGLGFSVAYVWVGWLLDLRRGVPENAVAFEEPYVREGDSYLGLASGIVR